MGTFVKLFRINVKSVVTVALSVSDPQIVLPLEDVSLITQLVIDIADLPCAEDEVIWTILVRLD
jgi:hypothetical protein